MSGGWKTTLRIRVICGEKLSCHIIQYILTIEFLTFLPEEETKGKKRRRKGTDLRTRDDQLVSRI